MVIVSIIIRKKCCMMHILSTRFFYVVMEVVGARVWVNFGCFDIHDLGGHVVPHFEAFIEGKKLRIV